MLEAIPDLIAEVPHAFQQLTGGDNVYATTSLLESRDQTGTLEVRTMIAGLTNLVYSAALSQKSAEQAVSWRDYKVGSSAIMANFTTGKIGFVSGFNIKPNEGPSDLNIHAEQMAISKGRMQGLNRLIGITVFADPNDLDANPAQRATLTPCSRCVQMFKDVPKASERTIILGTNQDLSSCEIYSAGSMMGPGNEVLFDGTFSLVSDADLDYYDDVIKPQIIPKIYSLYGQKIS